MSDRILSDAHNIRKLIREAEALADESMIACARLKQAMLAARQNPEVEVVEGQRALLRLSQAESQALAMSTTLLRVHDELSKIGREKMGGDNGSDTVIPNEALTLDAPVAETRVPADA
ncbi:hypothetical protein NAP1_10668 [Erythrobacter sp. NAP1]|uniref:hypothetical protein n=1 Tax=Erythrobacter sp. NAP1 TaxID=237727 RepID=UPI00006875D8|nr:hypothetical protein [Erythrobacter sp. NAP1]EAQ28051.1 hypothetical protein NAP1_10668 [Erythrobacter sp. NAP1]